MVVNATPSPKFNNETPNLENKVQKFLIMDFQQEFYVEFVVLASDAGIFGTDVDVIFGTDKYEKNAKSQCRKFLNFTKTCKSQPKY